MKGKAFATALLLLLVCAFALLAKDITATTSDGRTVILHDNGKWEYYTVTETKAGEGILGTWALPEDYFDIILEQALEESGISKTDPSYEMYKSIFYSAMLSESGMTADDLSNYLSDLFSVKFEKETMTITSDGETEVCKYSVDPSTRVLSILEPDSGQLVPIGTFDENYSTLYIMGEDSFFLTKK